MRNERLEEIEGKYTILHVSSKQDGFEYTEVVVEDLVFLIQNGFKQAERVQELETRIDKFYKLNMKLHKQNKRYREALEFYANKDIYKLVNNGLTAKVPIIYDCGKVANEVLMEESE